MRQSRPREVKAKWACSRSHSSKAVEPAFEIRWFHSTGTMVSASRTQRATELEEIFPLAGRLEDRDWWKERADLLGDRAGALASDPTCAHLQGPR